MSLKDFETLEKAAKVPFYYNADGYIIIPTNSVFACLANANSEAPARLRIDNLRSALTMSDFVTTKKKEDGWWERFAVVKSGTGQTLSNQRGLRRNAYIKNFSATGTIEMDEKMVKPSDLMELLNFAGRVIGIGASRKQGYGRFIVTSK